MISQVVAFLLQLFKLFRSQAVPSPSNQSLASPPTPPNHPQSPQVSPKPSEDAYNLIKRFEGYSSIAYQDIKGVWTIGYGETGPHVIKGLSITQPDALEWLIGRCNQISTQIATLVRTNLSQGQIDALTSLIYNIGITAFGASTCLRLINEKDLVGAGNELLKWDHVNGKVVEGLYNRRRSEWRLFMGQ